MEWKMVWKEILFGFTVAGFISVFVPQVFWDTLFIGAGGGQGLAFLAVLEMAAVAPNVAFFTVTGSHGNVTWEGRQTSGAPRVGTVCGRMCRHCAWIEQ